MNRRTLFKRAAALLLAPSVAKLAPPVAPPVVGLTRVSRSRKVEWLEDEIMPRYSNGYVRIASAPLNTYGFREVPVPGIHFRPGDLLRNEETGENLFVTDELL